MKTELEESVSSKIYELSKRGICYLCWLYFRFVIVKYNDCDIINLILTLSHCIQYFAVEFGVAWSVEVAEIMRLQLRTAGQSCDGSDSRGCRRKTLRRGPTIWPKQGELFTFKESCCSSCLRWISVHGVPLRVSGTSEHRFVQQTLCRPRWDTMASG